METKVYCSDVGVFCCLWRSMCALGQMSSTFDIEEKNAGARQLFIQNGA